MLDPSDKRGEKISSLENVKLGPADISNVFAVIFSKAWVLTLVWASALLGFSCQQKQGCAYLLQYFQLNLHHHIRKQFATD